MMEKKKEQLFDQWPDAYDQWFTTPIGSLVKKYETELILDFVKPGKGEIILDAGCGTGVFTQDILSAGSKVIGLDISRPMLIKAGTKLERFPFHPVVGNILNLPFPESSFDKVVSITALEFIRDTEAAVRELFRVAKSGGTIIVATLNSLSPWALKRAAEAKERHSIFETTIFRSPDDLISLGPAKALVKTAVHFQKEDDPEKAILIEREGESRHLNTGAFVAARWEKK